jgi:hypothetical protein
LDPLLLRDAPRTGTVGMQRWLTTVRDAHLVDPTSIPDAVKALESVCNIWGGAYHLLIPVPDEAVDIPEPWRTIVAATDVARTVVRGRLPVPQSPQKPNVGGFWVAGAGWGDMPLAVLARMDRPEQGFRTVRTANDFELSHPWAIAYLAAWGRLPTELDPQHLRLSGLRQGVTYTDIIPIDSSMPAEPGAVDLLASLRDMTTMTAASLSCVRLGRASAPTGSQFEGEPPTFPLRFHDARECGPNVVVVYEPGNVEDLCLLWHLRAVHGLRPGLPLGVPVTADVAAALSRWWSEFAMHSWGLRPTKGYLVSASVSMDTLRDLASSAGNQWSAISWPQVLQPSWGCGIGSSEVAVFENGRAELLGVHPSEVAALGNETVEQSHRSLELVVTPVGGRLPPSRTLATADISARYRGGTVLQIGGTRETTTLRWPTGFTVLDGVMRDRGLRCSPSEPGRLAETLLSRADRLGGLGPLLDPGSQELLARLGERHGMNWFKRQLRTVLNIRDDVDASIEERLGQIEANVEQRASAPSEEEQGDISFEDVRRVFANTTAAEAWLAWADEMGLVLRGTQIRCHHCTARFWRPLAEMSPPITCRGCGTMIDRPFGYNTVKFRYRGSELLLRLVKSDAIVHALAYRFLTELLRPNFNEVGPIFGGYPGITVNRPDQRDPLGEADDLFVMIDGGLGVGECKTRAAGLTSEETEKLGRLADVVEASWTFTATLDRSSACGPQWRVSPSGGRIPHFSLTAEHLFDLAPINTVGSNPLGWRTTYMATGGHEPTSEEEHHAQVVAMLRRYEEWSRVRDLPWWRTEP